MSSGWRGLMRESTVDQIIYRRRLTLACAVALPVFSFLAVLAATWLGRVDTIVPGIIALLWFAGTLWWGVLWVISRCPRCGHLFFRRKYYGNPFSKRCMNCRLPLTPGLRMGPLEQRALHAWLAQPSPRGPVPDIGLKCMRCAYPLRDLIDSRCPECGTRFDIEKILGMCTMEFGNVRELSFTDNGSKAAT